MILIEKVSIIIPTYNYKKFVCDAIDSVLNQDYENIEVIVIDDGSTDGTRECLEKYGDKILYVYQDNQGPSVARNTGLQLATGDYLGFLDADDVFQAGKITKQVSFLGNESNIGLVYSDYYCVDKKLKIIDHFRSKGFKNRIKTIEGLIEKNVINTSTVLMKREIIDEIGLFNVEYKYLEDLDYWLRIAFEYRLGYINSFLVKTRSHGYNLRRNTSTRDKINNGKAIINKYRRQLKSIK